MITCPLNTSRGFKFSQTIEAPRLIKTLFANARALTTVLLFSLMQANSFAAEAPLTQRYGEKVKGDIELIGNAIVTCDLSDPACVTAMGTGQPSNPFTMSHIDIDAPAAGTFNSSSADLTLTGGATVLFAGLYWAGTTEGSIAPPNIAARNSVRLQTPTSGAYIPLTGVVLGDTTFNDDSYSGFIDITSHVLAAGSGTYTVADIQVSTGTGSTGPWGGWSIAVVYEDTTASCRSLNIYDGYENFAFATEAVTITGFEAPSTGPVTATLGFFMGDGDRQNTNPDDATDVLTLNGTTLSNALNPANNFFNNTISRLGVNVTNRSPGTHEHNLVVDVDTVDASGILATSSTSATIQIASNEGLWWPLLTVAIDTRCPDLGIEKVSSASGSPVSPGDIFTYSIEVTNNSADGSALDVILQDTLPTGLSYVPGTAEKTYPANVGGTTGSFTAQMPQFSCDPLAAPQATCPFDAAGKTQSYTVNSPGDVPTGATLLSYGFTSQGNSIDWLSDISLVASYPSGTAYSLGGGSFGGNGAGSWNISQGPDPFSGPAAGTYSFNWDDSTDFIAGDENTATAGSFTITYQTAGTRGLVTDPAAAPPNMVTAADQIELFPGESLVVTFDVSVDSPLSFDIHEFENQAEARSNQILTPVEDSVVDQVIQFDFGDAPNSYLTNLASLGAQHNLVSGTSLFIGSALDSEGNGSPSANGAGDGADEDGVSFQTFSDGSGSLFQIDASITGTNNTGNTAMLCGYLDGSADAVVNGTFERNVSYSTVGQGSASAGNGNEEVCIQVPAASGAATSVSFPAVAGFTGASALCSATSSGGIFNCTLSFNPNFTSNGSTYARFRLTTDPAFFSNSSPSPTGLASDGEVEDYLLNFNPTLATIGEVDLRSETIASALDMLNVAQLSDASLYALLSSWQPDQANDFDSRDSLIEALQNYLDPDGDGSVAVLLWDTIEEKGTIGFYAERVKPNGQRDRINNELLPGLITAPMGGEYLLFDANARGGKKYGYFLIEQEATGRTLEHGPYILELN